MASTERLYRALYRYGKIPGKRIGSGIGICSSGSDRWIDYRERFACIEPLLALLGVNTASFGITEEQLCFNLLKIQVFHKPTLIIHAQYDHIIALSEGKALYEACPARDKKLLAVAGANHNDIFFAGMDGYLKAIEWLVAQIGTGDE
jgi:fermentation-respiration switch protein FrsA (DUF1100 family)